MTIHADLIPQTQMSRNRSKAIAPIIKGLDPSEFVRVMSIYNKGKVRARVVGSEVHLCAQDMLPDELMTVGRTGYAEMKQSAREWFKRNCKARARKVGSKNLLLVPSDRMREFATYVYHRAQGVDFRACFADLPETLDDGMGDVWDSNDVYPRAA